MPIIPVQQTQQQPFSLDVPDAPSPNVSAQGIPAQALAGLGNTVSQLSADIDAKLKRQAATQYVNERTTKQKLDLEKRLLELSADSEDGFVWEWETDATGKKTRKVQKRDLITREPVRLEDAVRDEAEKMYISGQKDAPSGYAQDAYANTAIGEFRSTISSAQSIRFSKMNEYAKSSAVVAAENRAEMLYALPKNTLVDDVYTNNIKIVQNNSSLADLRADELDKLNLATMDNVATKGILGHIHKMQAAKKMGKTIDMGEVNDLISVTDGTAYTKYTRFDPGQRDALAKQNFAGLEMENKERVARGLPPKKRSPENMTISEQLSDTSREHLLTMLYGLKNEKDKLDKPEWENEVNGQIEFNETPDLREIGMVKGAKAATKMLQDRLRLYVKSNVIDTPLKAAEAELRLSGSLIYGDMHRFGLNDGRAFIALTPAEQRMAMNNANAKLTVEAARIHREYAAEKLFPYQYNFMSIAGKTINRMAESAHAASQRGNTELREKGLMAVAAKQDPISYDWTPFFKDPDVAKNLRTNGKYIAKLYRDVGQNLGGTSAGRSGDVALGVPEQQLDQLVRAFDNPNLNGQQVVNLVKGVYSVKHIEGKQVFDYSPAMIETLVTQGKISPKLRAFSLLNSVDTGKRVDESVLEDFANVYTQKDMKDFNERFFKSTTVKQEDVDSAMRDSVWPRLDKLRAWARGSNRVIDGAEDIISQAIDMRAKRSIQESGGTRNPDEAYETAAKDVFDRMYKTTTVKSGIYGFRNEHTTTLPTEIAVSKVVNGKVQTIAQDTTLSRENLAKFMIRARQKPSVLFEHFSDSRFSDYELVVPSATGKGQDPLDLKALELHVRERPEALKEFYDPRTKNIGFRMNIPVEGKLGKYLDISLRHKKDPTKIIPAQLSLDEIDGDQSMFEATNPGLVEPGRGEKFIRGAVNVKGAATKAASEGAAAAGEIAGKANSSQQLKKFPLREPKL